MKTHLLLAMLAAVLLVGCGKKPIALTEKERSDAQAEENRAYFQYPDAEIHGEIDGGRSIMYVTRNFSRENGSDKLDFGCGAGSEKMGKFQGRYTYQFVGKSYEGDVYVFTIEPMDGTRLVVPFVYNGQPATIYDAQGMKVVFADKRVARK